MSSAATIAPCSECPAGTGVVQLCNTTRGEEEEEDTQCEPCIAGSTFSDSSSRHLNCRSCRVCPDKSRVKRECNTTHDTECECERDFYQEMTTIASSSSSENGTLNVEGGGGGGEKEVHPARHHHGSVPPMPTSMSCRACDLCPHGYGAARACSSSHNTVCRKCPTSTYSSVLSSSHGCLVCTVCRDDQVTLHECSPIMDTVCAGIIHSLFKFFPSLPLCRHCQQERKEKKQKPRLGFLLLLLLRRTLIC